MKITLIGGGAHRVLGILRGALAIPGVLDGGEVFLYDLDKRRAEVMGRMLQKTPEYRRSNCRLRWAGTMEDALSGADIVGVIMPAGSIRAHVQGHAPSLRHGFISSDNISPNGAMAAVRIAPVILDIARKMEIHCPNAWMVNFVNPVGVLSGMVNNHTRIRAFGVCQGFTNHLWDISRIFGRDEIAPNLEVVAAGVNHLSYVVKGKWEGHDLLDAISARLSRGDWRPPELQSWWNAKSQANIMNSVFRLVRVWQELGVLVFSTEPDGIVHLMYDDAIEELRNSYVPSSADEVDSYLAERTRTRVEADKTFEEYLNRDLDDSFWDNQRQSDYRMRRQDNDIFVRIFAALAGVREARIATSRLNEGAIAGIKDRHVVEYTQILFKNTIRHEGPYEIPDVVHGITAAFAAHQTLLGDALVEEDPHRIAEALLAYPVGSYASNLRSLYRELFAINAPFIAPQYQEAVKYLGKWCPPSLDKAELAGHANGLAHASANA